MRNGRGPLVAGAVAVGLAGGVLGGCGSGGPPPSTPARTIAAFVHGWDERSWPTMAGQVDAPPADFASVNRAALADIGATGVSVTPGAVTTAATGTTAAAPLTARYNRDRPGHGRPPQPAGGP